MASPLQHLDRDAMLLMYLSEELGDDDRAAVDRQLGRDPALRQRLTDLRLLHESLADAFDKLDAHSHPLAAEHGIARTLREMRRQELNLAERRANIPAEGPRAWPRWVYPVASVAALIFLILGLWAANIIELPGQNVAPDDRLAMNDGEDDTHTTVLDAELERSLALSVSSSAALDDADQHFQALQNEDDDVSPPPM